MAYQDLVFLWKFRVPQSQAEKQKRDTATDPQSYCINIKTMLTNKHVQRRPGSGFQTEAFHLPPPS